MKDADEQARHELGSSFELVELGDVTTLSYLLDEIAVAERVDGLIDRCLKRLLFIRGLKSSHYLHLYRRPTHRRS